MAVIRGLIGKSKTYRQILAGFDRYQRAVVTGEEDNLWPKPFDGEDEGDEDEDEEEEENEISEISAGDQTDGDLADAGELNDHKIYKLTAKKTGWLTVRLTGTGTDFDVYLKKGSVPSKQSFDRGGYSPNSRERVRLRVKKNQEIFILVIADRGQGGSYSLQTHL